MDLERDSDVDRDLDGDLSRRFQESVGELCAPPVVLMVAQATAQGRALRRRRRLAVAGSALVAAALVGTVGVVTVRQARGPAFAAAPATAAPVTDAPGDPVPEPRSGPAAEPAATGADGMLAVLSSLLPSGAYSNFAPGAGMPASGGSFRVDFNDGPGPTTLVVSLIDADGEKFDCAHLPALPRATPASPDDCTQTTLDNGDHMVAYQGAEAGSGLVGRTVAVRHEGGTVVLITSMNGTTHPADGRTTARGTRPGPALAEDRLAAMADDENWLKALSPQLIAEGAAWRRAWG
ncbi:hypothetical protein OG871_12015 [Kitasatospora sp. NBC_00374]|uniref:hypothetical protein n=1 Tax=Kitasatospora sp. NBC_00374 TaxID=2975964 RepID=UPI003251BE8B